MSRHQEIRELREENKKLWDRLRVATEIIERQDTLYRPAPGDVIKVGPNGNGELHIHEIIINNSRRMELNCSDGMFGPSVYVELTRS